jgi:hypothetical protein
MTQRVLGPSGSKRRRTRLIVLTALAASALGVFFVMGAGAVVSGSPSSFESGDGDMTVGTANNSDWNCFAGNDGFHSPASDITVGAACSSNLVTANALAVTDPAATTSDNSWVNGQKMDSACAQLASNKNPAKDDFTNIASYNETLSSNNHLYLYGATIRVAANGNASENVELNQVAGTASCPILRSAGDKLLAFDYLNGGTNLDLHVLTWVTPASPNLDGGTSGDCIVSHDSPPCWGETAFVPNSVDFEGQANQADIAAGANGISYQALVAGEFAEFGVDLTDALNLSTTACNTFAQTVWESRSSGSSFSSNPEDISIENKTVSNCGTITIIKHTNPRGVNQNFTFTPSGFGGGTNFTLNDSGNTTGDTLCGSAPCNKKVFSNVLAGSYTVLETQASGFSLESLTCSSGGAQDGTEPLQANITLAAGGAVTCTYTNKRLTTAIQITKYSAKGGGNTITLQGAHFAVCTNSNVTGKADCTAAVSGSDDVTTNSSGIACVGGLALSTTYYVIETQAPSYYKIDTTAAQPKTTGSSSATCSDSPYTGPAISFTDTPLSTVEVKFTSLAGTGVTTSQIICKKGTPATYSTTATVVAAQAEGNGTADNEANPVRDDTDETFGNSTSTLVPGVYTCTVDIDP